MTTTTRTTNRARSSDQRVDRPTSPNPEPRSRPLRAFDRLEQLEPESRRRPVARRDRGRAAPGPAPAPPPGRIRTSLRAGATALLAAPESVTTVLPGQVRQPSGRRSRSFVVLFSLLAVLNAVGLTFILSASSVSSMAETGSPWSQFLKQAMWLVVGLTGMIVALRIDYHRWQRWARPFMVVSVVLLVAVLLVGRRVNGARRWLGIGQAQIQPSEMTKLAALLFCADLLARRSHKMADTRLTLRPILVVVGFSAALVLVQPNLSTAILICVIAFVLLFVSGVPMRSLAKLGLALAVLAAGMAVVAPYRMQRLVSFSDPFEDPYGNGYQAAQSQIALNNGDVTGTGFGQGRGKYGYLPEADTDFIFSVVGEEAGFLGACVVIGLFMALGAVAVKVALNAPDRFGMLVATGVATWILVQAFVNIGVAVGILPNTGVPLPFLSAGGSSLLFTMIASGILLNISRHTA